MAWRLVAGLTGVLSVSALVAACSSDNSALPPSFGEAGAGNTMTETDAGGTDASATIDTGTNAGSSGSGSSSGGNASGSGSGGGSGGDASASGSGSGGGPSGSGSGGGPSGGGSGSGSGSGGTSPPSVDAGPAPRNGSCTPLSQETGTIIDTTHGRLDGTLVYVLPVGGSSACNGDGSHVHLQVQASGNIYDVAVDIGSTGDDVGTYETQLALPGGAWAEGWHGSDTLAYPSLGLHSTSFPTTSPSGVAATVESLLEDTSQISIFCTGYSQGDGCHDVHYEDGSGNDGAIVLDPSAATPSILFFRFSDQSF